MWPFNNSIEFRIERAKVGSGWNKPLKYAVVTTENGRTAIVFEKKVNWVAFDAESLKQLRELLDKGSNDASSATARERHPERKEDVR